ncbi:MAG TPA: hypothetical protein DEH25_08385 [Chloroflexi bacterium]|nr:hypothetical protein [Chloroflexota bacterium]HBY09143.1 hypothetical protein [Chloroflexota bacterium]
MPELVQFHKLEFTPISPEIIIDPKAAELRQNSLHWWLHSSQTALRDEKAYSKRECDLWVPPDILELPLRPK